MIISEQIKKIGIQGYAGSFHQMAAEKFYEQPIELHECGTFLELTSSVKNENCEEAIMAIENSIAGSILPNYNLIIESDLSIIGEVYLPIRHQLLAIPGTTMDQIKEIQSHPMALLQCSKFLATHKKIKLLETTDTAWSARAISKGNTKTMAAIASRRAAEIYNLEIIASDIEDDKSNYTRFLILSKTQRTITDRNKASLNFKLKHQPGSLSKALSAISLYEHNITKLQSVPIIGSPGQYAFHIDVEFEHEGRFKEMINELSLICLNLNVLGVYKKGKIC